MQNIHVTPHLGGARRWEPIDADGVSITRGFVARQDPATAWARQSLDAGVRRGKV
jgi:hypothetical protein